jgi:hypothetical protein
MAIVSLGEQRVTIYDAEGRILRAPVSTGQTGYETPAGIYSVIQKEAEHYSNLYDDASMPFMQRITWSGIALHAGPLPGYPASHGCVRMPYEFAQRLFDMTKIGMRVIVARNDVRPVEIDHPVLFKPKLVRADLALKALTAHWDAAREEAQAAAPDAAPPEADGPSPASPAKPLVMLKSLAAAKIAEATSDAPMGAPLAAPVASSNAVSPGSAMCCPPDGSLTSRNAPSPPDRALCFTRANWCWARTGSYTSHRLESSSAYGGRRSSFDRRDAIRAGFHLHLTKPIEVATLVEAVASLARRRQPSAAGHPSSI